MPAYGPPFHRHLPARPVVGRSTAWRSSKPFATYTPAMSSSMFTIGYQGATLEGLIESLASADVSVVVDTRDTPHSRRPEFRPRSLESALSEVGIRYLSARALGAPKDLRALASGDWDGFADGYRERLSLVREELEVLLPIVAAERVCLLCFEADPDACHRSLLAHEIQTLLDVSATHLRPGRSDQTDDHEGVLALGEVAQDELEVARTITEQVSTRAISYTDARGPRARSRRKEK